MYHYTFTDYLDDVSGNYIDPKILIANNGNEAAKLSNPSNIKMDYDAIGVGNKLRGDPTNKDAFYTLTIGVSYLFKKNCGAGGNSGLRRRSSAKCANF
jgi:hypothetical protein